MSIGDREITLLRGPDDLTNWKRDVALLFLKHMKPGSDLNNPRFTKYSEHHVWNLMYRSVQPIAERLKQDGWEATYEASFRLWQAVNSNDWLAPLANVRLDTTSPGAARLIKALYMLTLDGGSILAMRNLFHTMGEIKSKSADLGLQLRDDFMMGRLLPKLHSHMTEKTLTNMHVLARNNLLPWGATVRWLLANHTEHNTLVTGLNEFLRDIRYDTPAPGSNTGSGTGPNTGSGTSSNADPVYSVFGFDPDFGPSSGPRIGPGFGPGFGLSRSWP